MSKVQVYRKVKGQFCQNIIIKVKGHFLGRGHPKVKGHFKVKGQFQDWQSNGHIVKFIALEMTPISHKSRFFIDCCIFFPKAFHKSFHKKLNRGNIIAKEKRSTFVVLYSYKLVTVTLVLAFILDFSSFLLRNIFSKLLSLFLYFFFSVTWTDN